MVGVKANFDRGNGVFGAGKVREPLGRECNMPGEVGSGHMQIAGK
jgi:hypothetical protein